MQIASRGRYIFSARATRRKLPAELLLAAACCRWPPQPSREAAIRTAAAAVSDWEGFARLASRHRVTGLVHDALRGVVELPGPVAKRLARASRRIAQRNLGLVAELARLQAAFDAEQIPVLVLKGLPLAQLAFGAYRSKQNRDLDLLVPPTAIKRAIHLLEREGYVPDFPARRLSQALLDAIPRYANEIGLVHARRRLHVELHWRLVSNPVLLEGIGAFSCPQRVALSGAGSVCTLPLDDLAAYLCVHGAYHGWSRLKWLADLNALIATGGIDVTALYRRAEACGADLCVGQALILCSVLFDHQLPPGLVEKLGKDRRIAKLVMVALRSITRSGPPCSGGVWAVLANLRLQFLLGRGRRFFWRQCRLTAVGILDVVELPLPRPLHFLYPLLRVPLWLRRRVFGRADKLASVRTQRIISPQHG